MNTYPASILNDQWTCIKSNSVLRPADPYIHLWSELSLVVGTYLFGVKQLRKSHVTNFQLNSQLQFIQFLMFFGLIRCVYTMITPMFQHPLFLQCISQWTISPVPSFPQTLGTFREPWRKPLYWYPALYVARHYSWMVTIRLSILAIKGTGVWVRKVHCRNTKIYPTV